MSELARATTEPFGHRPPLAGKPCRSSASARTRSRNARMQILRLLQQQLAVSQWWPAQQLAHHQARKLSALLAHAERHSPYCRDVLRNTAACADLDPLRRLRSLPTLSRQTLQTRYHEICADWPLAHGAASEVQTSGSTGQPVRVKRTALCQLHWLAATLRDHLWHRRDFKGTLAAIRVAAHAADGGATVYPSWGEASDAHSVSGPLHVLPIATDVRVQARWLAELDPQYLLSYPSNLLALLQTMAAEGLSAPQLREIRCFGETVTDELRQAVAQLPGVSITDLYSSHELGVIALQCPVSGAYHVQAESMIVEILNEQNKPCAPGEIGRVVVTDLLNFATPLIRYELGDYAEQGAPCCCGSGLPTLKRILGRHRNMIVLPGGGRQWPNVSGYRLRAVLPGLKQWQLVQREINRFELRLVVDVPATLEQEVALKNVVQKALGYSFEVQFEYLTATMAKSSGEKWEAIVCAV